MKKILTVMLFSILFINLGNQALAQSDDKLVILHTELGKLVIEFFPSDAPNHTSNMIELAESGFYDNTLFHRIISGFMIQGGDPNTIAGDKSTWGTGGPDDSVDAEFNTIKHNRGIVSMARSADPNSAGSQFFIVHQNSNFLDENYTVFGRIVTDESFETLDKIASVEKDSRDAPTNPEQVRITKAEVVNRSDVSDLLELSEPERTGSESVVPLSGSQLYENEELGVAFTAPEGWLLQQPPKTTTNSPDVVVVGPKIGEINPVFTLTILESNGRTFDELIVEKNNVLEQSVEEGSLKILSQEKLTVNDRPAYFTGALGAFASEGIPINIQFREIIISASDKFYIFSYSNSVENFKEQDPKFEETVLSFKLLSEEQTPNEEGGGCLIATATYGSELAPQVQQLRELRDNTILSTQSGTSFMSGFNQFYYSFSPYIADFERESPIFKELVKITITPMLSTLSILNLVDIDSEQEMLGFGIGVILLNIGMYFVAPAMIIHRIRK